MMDDDRIEQLLRSACPPVSDRRPSHNLWPRLEARFRMQSNRSWLDLSLAAIIVILLALFPELLLLLAVHF